MESAAGKSSAPGDQALPFIWCMSNAAETASSDLANRAKNLADAYGYSFHGYAFTRNPELSNTYQETVRLATQYLHDKASPDKKGYYAEALNMLNTMDKLRHDTSLDDDKDNAFRKRFVKVAL
jgi:hypothetical protein